MDITRFAIEKKRITSVVLLLIAVAGLMAYSSMPRAEDPGFIVRTALIITNFPGASPERVELLVTEKLEKAIQQMPEVDDIISESKPGKSIIYVNVKESYRQMRPIWDSLRRKVDDAKSELPSAVVGPFVNDEFGDVFGTLIAVSGEGYSYAELKDIADDIRNELLLIEQVAKVDIFGAQEERVFVEFNNARLAEVGISPGQLQQILESRNIIFPGGEVFTEDEQIVLEPSGNFESVDELKKTVIKLPWQNQLVFLESIANIERGYIDPPRTKVRYGGQPALMVAVSLREGGNITVLGEEVLQQVQRFKEIYPIGVDFDIVYLQSAFVNKKVSDFVSNLLQAVVIVMGTMLVFLGLRTGLVVSSLIPMAMVMALLVMSFFDIGLDQMSLASLIIALGMLVDNAIVMSESIMVQMSEGKGAVPAAIDSAQELRIPLLTSSLTTAAAFLPIFLAESAVGEYTAPLFKVVTITLLCSWLLSLTMTPLLCVSFLKVKKTEEGYHTKFYQTYRDLLLGGLRRPWVTLTAILVIFFGVMQLFRFIPQIFFPANDKAVMEMGLTMPVGTPLEKTDRVIAQIDDFIGREMPAQFDEKGEVVKHGIVSWTSFIGSGAPKYALGYNPEPSTPEYAYILLNTTDRWKIDDEFIPKLDAFCRQAFPDLNADIGPLDMGPPVEAPIQVRVSGKDANQVFAYTDQVKAYLENEITGSKNVRDDWGLRSKKLFVRINQPRAQRAGLTSEDIAISLQTVLSGIQTTDYREEDEVIPVVLRSVAADRKDIGKLETHNIYVQQT
ncbi:MAG TPA: efflux RND transporter permease subunit, partial [bacterium]